MKYWEMIHVGGPSSVRSTSDTTGLQAIIDDLKTKLQTRNNTVLNDKQVSEIMDRLLYFQETYFKEIPLAAQQVEGFVWNIPYDVYRSMTDIRDMHHADILDPTMLLYLFCCEDPGFVLGKFLTIIHDLYYDNRDDIENNAETYDNYVNDDESEDTDDE